MPPNGGDGTSGGMEHRVRRLEDDYKEVRADLKTLLVDVAVLKERVTHLPTKGWAVGAIVTTLGLITAIVTLAPKLQAWAGLIKP
ncbi:hypothetical protein ACSD7O_24985 [Methylorubrum extorquens]|uniref:hypothetical protein n=1 Tax=Methylorubrum extorquens TaxID=408 RepID=UPI003F5FE53B